ncbi:hypothetical protein [Dietzia alimentaria]|uniref:hypothetical protein n=1 Tax=Dietzia alimentaria TaxID=665550 RepID=UPI000299EEBA|nr:hypothetical protein [Dietzia alimentaria]
MYELTYRGVNNSTWQLVGAHQGAEGVGAEEVSGFVASATTTLEPAPERAGVVLAGYSFEAMTGSLKVRISDRWRDDEMLDDPGRLFRRWRSAWSPFADGEFTLRSQEGPLLRTRARLPGASETPAKSPRSVGTVSLVTTLEVTCHDGVWLGAPQRYSGAAQVLNLGELEGYPRVEWSGSGATVSGPGLPSVILPTTAVPAVWHTDPATGGLVTVDGEPATALRRQLRGRVAPVPILPGESAPWTFTGCTGVIEPLFCDPWRW